MATKLLLSSAFMVVAVKIQMEGAVQALPLVMGSLSGTNTAKPS